MGLGAACFALQRHRRSREPSSSSHVSIRLYRTCALHTWKKPIQLPCTRQFLRIRGWGTHVAPKTALVRTYRRERGGPPCHRGAEARLRRRTVVLQRGWCERGAVPDVSSHFGSRVRVDAEEIYTVDLAREKMHMRRDVPPLQRSSPGDRGLPASPYGGGDLPVSARGDKIQE